MSRGLRSIAWLAGAIAACAPPATSGPDARAPAAANPKGAAPAPAAEAPFDPCAGQKPLDHEYTGILRGARCDQERFLRMAYVADQLGVDCDYCHIQDPSDPKKMDYAASTPHKEIAAWMSTHLMRSLRAADGSEILCKSCHTGPDGKPAAKILGAPRDPSRAAEWMTTVLVNRFRAADGQRLRCKSCHGANPTEPGWKAKVILHGEQLPPHEAPR